LHFTLFILLDENRSDVESKDTEGFKKYSTPRKHLIQEILDSGNGDKEKLLENMKTLSADFLDQELKAMSMASLYEGRNEENISVGGPRIDVTK
jgi:hypothetical protein